MILFVYLVVARGFFALVFGVRIAVFGDVTRDIRLNACGTAGDIRFAVITFADVLLAANDSAFVDNGRESLTVNFFVVEVQFYTHTHEGVAVAQSFIKQSLDVLLNVVANFFGHLNLIECPHVHLGFPLKCVIVAFV